MAKTNHAGDTLSVIWWVVFIAHCVEWSCWKMQNLVAIGSLTVSGVHVSNNLVNVFNNCISFALGVITAWTPQEANISWNSMPTNSLPLSWMDCRGQGDLQQHCWSCSQSYRFWTSGKYTSLYQKCFSANSIHRPNLIPLEVFYRSINKQWKLCAGTWAFDRRFHNVKKVLFNI